MLFFPLVRFFVILVKKLLVEWVTKKKIKKISKEELSEFNRRVYAPDIKFIKIATKYDARLYFTYVAVPC